MNREILDFRYKTKRRPAPIEKITDPEEWLKKYAIRCDKMGARWRPSYCQELKSRIPRYVNTPTEDIMIDVPLQCQKCRRKVDG